MPNFKIIKTERETWFFELRDERGSLLLTGRKMPSKAACQGAILSARLNAKYKDNFEIRVTPTREFYVALLSMGTEELLANSSLYMDRSACEALIKKVRELVG